MAKPGAPQCADALSGKIVALHHSCALGAADLEKAQFLFEVCHSAVLLDSSSTMNPRSGPVAGRSCFSPLANSQNSKRDVSHLALVSPADRQTVVSLGRVQLSALADGVALPESSAATRGSKNETFVSNISDVGRLPRGRQSDRQCAGARDDRCSLRSGNRDCDRRKG